MGELKFGDAFSEGWNIFKDNMGVCILASLIASLIGGVTCGICAGPLTAGLFIMLRRMAKKSEPKPEIGDVFKGFEVFLHSFLLFLLVGVGYMIVQTVLLCIPIIGWLLFVVIAFVVGPIAIWSLMLVANRRMKCTEALGLVIKETFNGKFLMPLLFGIVAGIVGGAGVFLCCIGQFFTMPYALCVYAAAYEQVFGDEAAPQAVEAEVVA